MRLQDDIHKSIQAKNHTIGISVDLEKAYDMIWKDGLMYKLKKTRNKQAHARSHGGGFNWFDRTPSVRIWGASSGPKYMSLHVMHVKIVIYIAPNASFLV